MQHTRMSAQVLRGFVKASAACGAALMLLPAAKAHAQIAQAGTSASIRLGAYLPTDSETRRRFGNTFFNAGLDYYFQQTGVTERAVVSVDYMERGSHGTRLQIIPVTVGQQFIYTPRAQGVRPYFGYGIGAYFIEAKSNHDTNINGAANGGGGGNTSDGTEFGGYAAVGLDITSNLFVDARYHLAGSLHSVNPDGLVLSAGLRF